MASRRGKVGQKAFLAAFANSASITAAAKAAGIDRTTHYAWLKTEGYPEAFAEATLQAGDFVEDVAVAHATEGVLKAKWYQGKPVGTERVFAESTLGALLRGFKPHKYRQTGAPDTPPPTGAPISLEQKRLQHLTDDELASLHALAKKLTADPHDGSGDPQAAA